ncbi:MAG: hypothetical protein ABI745_05550 [Caldimonas sp.]
MDVGPLWNFADPAASEAAFREALRTTGDSDDVLTLKTQIARSLGLRARFDEAHAVLDDVEPQLVAAGPEPRVRYLLERGRAYRSAKLAERSRPLFVEAAELAAAARLDGLRIDALHMVALVEPTPAAQLRASEQALETAIASSNPAARGWEASLANNIGMSLHDLGRDEEALASFQRALVARRHLGQVREIRIGRWMIAWTLRMLERSDEALVDLRALEAEYAAAGSASGYVFEEIAENLALLGRHDEARPYFARAHRALAADTSPDRVDDERLARLQRLSH